MATIFGATLTGPLRMVTFATLLAPPGPAQLSEYVVLAVRATVVSVPLMALVPLQPPEAVHNVAFDELHDSTEVPPVMTAFGLAARVAVGTTLTVTIAALLVPPGPVQVSEYVVPVMIGAVLWAPLADKVPLQPPAAAHEVAFVEVQVRTAVPPDATEVALAVSVAVGTTLTVMLAGLLVPPAPVQVSE
jgi:hypothetical protein